MEQKKIILIFTITLCSLIHGMEMKQSVLMDNDSLAWIAILRNGVGVFDYIQISSLAVSKKLDLILRLTACYRKECLNKRFNLKDNVIWHKYGAMCGRMEHDFCSICLVPQKDSSRRRGNGAHIRRFYLYEYDEERSNYTWQYQPSSVYYSDFHSCLSPQRAPFFDTESAFCFYHYGHCEMGHEKVHSGNIEKYEHRSSYRPWNLYLKTTRCMTNIKDEKSELIGLKVLLEFPELLNAFLESSKVYKEPQEPFKRYIIEIYDIEGVTIPENYRSYKHYFSQPQYHAFDDLPYQLRKAVVARYFQQKQNNAIEPIKKPKNKQRLLSCLGK